MFEIPHATIFVECPPFNGGALLLTGTTVVVSWAFGESLFSVEDSEILIWSIIDVIISVIFLWDFLFSRQNLACWVKM